MKSHEMMTLTYLAVTLLTLLVSVESCSRSCPPPDGGRPPGGGMDGPPPAQPRDEDINIPLFWSRPNPNFIICQAIYTDFTPNCYRYSDCPSGMTCKGPEQVDTSRPSYSYCFPQSGRLQGPPPPEPFLCGLRFPRERNDITRRCPSGLTCPSDYSSPPGGSLNTYEFKICKMELCAEQRPSK